MWLAYLIYTKYEVTFVEDCPFDLITYVPPLSSIGIGTINMHRWYLGLAELQGHLSGIYSQCEYRSCDEVSPIA